MIVIIVMNNTTFQLPPSDSLTKWIGGNYFSFRGIRRGEITCGDTLQQKFSECRGPLNRSWSREWARVRPCGLVHIDWFSFSCTSSSLKLNVSSVLLGPLYHSRLESGARASE